MKNKILTYVPACSALFRGVPLLLQIVTILLLMISCNMSYASIYYYDNTTTNIGGVVNYTVQIAFDYLNCTAIFNNSISSYSTNWAYHAIDSTILEEHMAPFQDWNYSMVEPYNLSQICPSNLPRCTGEITDTLCSHWTSYNESACNTNVYNDSDNNQYFQCEWVAGECYAFNSNLCAIESMLILHNYSCYFNINYSVGDTNVTTTDIFDFRRSINCSTTTIATTTTTSGGTTTTGGATTTTSSSTSTTGGVTTTTSGGTTTTGGSTSTTSGTPSTVTPTTLYGYSFPHGNHGTLPGLNGTGGNTINNGSLKNMPCTGFCIIGLNKEEFLFYAAIMITIICLVSIKPYKLGATASAISISFFNSIAGFTAFTASLMLVFCFLAVMAWFTEEKK